MKSKKTLVLGASVKSRRYSNLAIKQLLFYGHTVVDLGREVGMVEGVPIHAEKILLNDIDTVTLYLNPLHQEEYYDYILKIKPKRVIFNPGAENPEFSRLLEANGIQVEIACTLVLLGTKQY